SRTSNCFFNSDNLKSLITMSDKRAILRLYKSILRYIGSLQLSDHAFIVQRMQQEFRKPCSSKEELLMQIKRGETILQNRPFL
ncbi:hypothetical protein BOX15_Mlig018510g1, partial [Macrostomum lignano]